MSEQVRKDQVYKVFVKQMCRDRQPDGRHSGWLLFRHGDGYVTDFGNICMSNFCSKGSLARKCEWPPDTIQLSVKRWIQQSVESPKVKKPQQIV